MPPWPLGWEGLQATLQVPSPSRSQAARQSFHLSTVPQPALWSLERWSLEKWLSETWQQVASQREVSQWEVSSRELSRPEAW